VIELYKRHGTHEQCQSEIKTDLDLGRLPSGKFDTNDAIVHLASSAYNGLHLLGPERRDYPDPPPGQTAALEDRAAGNHVSGCQICCP
jgi:hypothetical protein